MEIYRFIENSLMAKKYLTQTTKSCDCIIGIDVARVARSCKCC